MEKVTQERYNKLLQENTQYYIKVGFLEDEIDELKNELERGIIALKEHGFTDDSSTIKGMLRLL